jgi:hypothetical protein
MDLYLLGTSRRRCLLFGSLDLIEAIEKQSDDRVVQAIAWFRRQENRLVSWFGRVLKSAHDYYVRLEDRIDPGERVLRAMASRTRFVVHHGPSISSADARSMFHAALKRRRRKQRFWFSADLIISAFAILFTPVLAPLPGPNVVLYFPFLRMLSHYRAIRGARAGLRSSEIEFKCLPDLVGLEENLRTPPSDRKVMLAAAGGLKIRGLEQFLERMV